MVKIAFTIYSKYVNVCYISKRLHWLTFILVIYYFYIIICSQDIDLSILQKSSRTSFGHLIYIQFTSCLRQVGNNTETLLIFVWVLETSARLLRCFLSLLPPETGTGTGISLILRHFNLFHANDPRIQEPVNWFANTHHLAITQTF